MDDRRAALRMVVYGAAGSMVGIGLTWAGGSWAYDRFHRRDVTGMFVTAGAAPGMLVTGVAGLVVLTGMCRFAQHVLRVGLRPAPPLRNNVGVTLSLAAAVLLAGALTVLWLDSVAPGLF